MKSRSIKSKQRSNVFKINVNIRTLKEHLEAIQATMIQVVINTGMIVVAQIAINTGRSHNEKRS